jgi:hypothetical protein
MPTKKARLDVAPAGPEVLVSRLGSDGDTFGSQEENYLRFGDMAVTPVTVSKNIRKKNEVGLLLLHRT